MIQQKCLQLQMKVGYGDYLKIAIWWGRNETFNSKKFKSIIGYFSDGGNEYIFGVWVGIFPIPRVSHKGWRERGTVHALWVQQFFDIFVKKRDTWHMILGDNPPRHCFVLRDLILIEFFQISHNCVTECMLQADFF